MSNFFYILRTLSAFAILLKFLGVTFVTDHFWWFALALFIGIIGSPITSKFTKKRKKKGNVSEKGEKQALS